jgi:hypothetical protein
VNRETGLAPAMSGLAGAGAAAEEMSGAAAADLERLEGNVVDLLEALRKLGATVLDFEGAKQVRLCDEC